MSERIAGVANSLLGQLEHSYETRKGYWKGGTVSIYGYGGGIIPRFSEVGADYPESKEFHTLRVQPPAGNYYTTDVLRNLADSWEKWGSGLVTFHGQTGNIMFIGATTENTQHFLRRDQRIRFRSRRRRPLRAHRAVLRRLGTLRAVLRQRAQDSPFAGEQLSPTTSTARHCPTSSSSKSPAVPTTA